MDVTLSVSFLKEQLSSTIEEAVKTAVETVLCETARLLGGKLADLQIAVAEKDRENQSLKLKLEVPESGLGAVSADGCLNGTSRTLKSTLKPTLKPTLSSGNRRKRRFQSSRVVQEPPREEHPSYDGFLTPFSPDHIELSGDPTAADYTEGHDVGLQANWELMSRVFKAEEHEGISLIDEDGTTQYADSSKDYLHSQDLRIISVPMEEEEPADFSPAQIKEEDSENKTVPTTEEAPELGADPNAESGEFSEYGVQSFAEQLRGRLEALAPEVIREYEKDSCFCELSRRKLIKIAVAYLVEEFGFYPTSAQKTMLAEHIVDLFPALRLCVPSAGINGIEHLYDPISRTGYIETRLRNFRRTLEADKKKYVLKRRRTEVPPSEQKPEDHVPEETRKWIALMKKTRPLAKNLVLIRNGMERTFGARRRWMLSKRPTVDAVITEYPRFLDVPSTIDSEFERLFPGKGESFLSKWDTCVLPKVRHIAEKEKHPEIGVLLEQSCAEKEDFYTLTMLKLLIHLLPPTNTGRATQPTKCSIKHAIRYLVEFAPDGTSVSSLLCDAGTSNGASSSQAKPYILSLGNLDNPSRQLFILAPAEKVVLPLQEVSLTRAIDKLFKFLWVFNLGYPMQLTSLYSFFEYIYGIEKPISSNTGKRSKVLELVSRLHMLS
ncbi:uncharacterized protein LOC136741940 [Amia ocellicauda]|uniref:uncharacterized protein LOC136741940 n=1 Tax=Amia ocellicauda TaxID=2972642 RepID=UPI003463ED44